MNIFNSAAVIFKIFGAKKLTVVDNMTAINNEYVNILSEVEELKEAIDNNDKVEVIDALGDIMMFCLQASYRVDADMSQVMKGIIDSQYTKLCTSQEDVSLTREYYSKLNVETYVESQGSYTIVKSLGNQTGSDGKEYPNDKVLKNQRTFKAPQSI